MVAPHTRETALVDKSETFRWMVRLGHAARGLVYLVLGYLALTTAGAAGEGGAAVFDLLQDVPLGTVVLWLMAIGLLAYAAFRLICAIGDLERQGTDARGIGKRIGYGASAVAHAVLAHAAFQYASGSSSGGSGGGEGTRQAAGTVLELPLGDLVIGLVGIGFFIGALMQAKSAATARFMHGIARGAPSAVKPIGQVGHAARAIVFAVIGWSLIRSAWAASESQVKGLGEAIVSLSGNGILSTIVALGLLFFGVFSFVVARFGVIPDVRAGDLKPALR